MLKKSWLFLGLILCVIAFSGGKAHAQSLSTDKGTYHVGDTATVSYSNPAKANETITVTVTSGGLIQNQKQTFTIKLDKDGNGSTTWKVPDWYMACFSAPGATLTVAIL